MKHIIILVGLICPLWLIAQDCGEVPTEGFITTDPENANNPKCPDVTNNFDWRTERWYTPYYKGKESDTAVASPFFNTANRAIPEIHETINHNGQDFEVEDGWELIMDGITKSQGNSLESDIIYLVLYNKFTATLRIFGAHYNITSSGAADYDYAVIQLFFSNGNAGLLHPTLQIAQPLDEPSIEIVERNAKLESPNSTKFFYADFPMGYDPCTCFRDALDIVQLEVEFKVIKESTITLYGRSVSISTTLEQIASGNTQLNDDFLTNVYRLDDLPEAGTHTFTTLANLEDHYKDLKDQASKLKEQYQAVQNLKTALEAAATLTPLLPISPIVGASSVLTAEALEALEGKAKSKRGKVEKQLKAAAKYTSTLSGSLKARKDAAVGAANAVGNTRIISSEMAFSGNIREDADRSGFGFLLPGQPGNSDNCEDDYYPMYDEVLGRFAVLETPVAEMSNAPISGSTSPRNHRMSFDGSSFKYMFNPAANINITNTKIYGALTAKAEIISGDYLYDFKNIEIVESLTNNDTTFFITPFVPIECLGSLNTEFSTTYGNILEFEVQLRLIIMYEYNQVGSDGNIIQNYEVLTYPVNQTTVSHNIFNTPTVNDNGDAIQNNLTISTTNYTVTQSVFAWDTIFINGDLTANSGVEVEIAASTIIMNGGSIGQGITLTEKETPFESCTLDAFDPADLSSYCGDENRYKANLDKNANLTEPPIVDDKPTKPIPFHSTPNPFANTFNIEFELDKESTTSLMVFDALGRVVETVVANDNLVAGQHLYQVDGSRLESGIYYVRLQTDDNTQTIKIIKQ